LYGDFERCDDSQVYVGHLHWRSLCGRRLVKLSPFWLCPERRKLLVSSASAEGFVEVSFKVDALVVSFLDGSGVFAFLKI
jgi:hypothetical protein